MMWPAPAFASAALSLLVERFFGYPNALYRRIGHPVTWMGALLTRLETRLNTRQAEPQAGRLRGVAALAVLLIEWWIYFRRQRAPSRASRASGPTTTCAIVCGCCSGCP